MMDKPSNDGGLAMSSPACKTPEQLAELRKVFFNAYMSCKSSVLGDLMDAGIAAVLAHAAPTWRPVSEPVPMLMDYYFIRYATGSIYMAQGREIRGGVITHWYGPITPPRFEEKPSGKH